jgi:hypothetical protein
MTDRALTLHALMAVIERHVDGEYHFTEEMFAEAAAIDEAWANACRRKN